MKHGGHDRFAVLAQILGPSLRIRRDGWSEKAQVGQERSSVPAKAGESYVCGKVYPTGKGSRVVCAWSRAMQIFGHGKGDSLILVSYEVGVAFWVLGFHGQEIDDDMFKAAFLRLSQKLKWS